MKSPKYSRQFILTFQSSAKSPRGINLIIKAFFALLSAMSEKGGGVNTISMQEIKDERNLKKLDQIAELEFDDLIERINLGNEMLSEAFKNDKKD